MEFQGTVTEVKEFRREHPTEKNTMVTVRSVTVNLPSPEKYDTNRLKVESETLKMGDTVRVLIVPIPKLTEEQVALTVTAIDEGRL